MPGRMVSNIPAETEKQRFLYRLIRYRTRITHNGMAWICIFWIIISTLLHNMIVEIRNRQFEDAEFTETVYKDEA